MHLVVAKNLSRSCSRSVVAGIRAWLRLLASRWTTLVVRHKVYYKGEGGGFPQVQVVVSYMNPCLPVVRFCTKVFQLHTNQLVV